MKPEQSQASELFSLDRKLDDLRRETTTLLIALRDMQALRLRMRMSLTPEGARIYNEMRMRWDVRAPAENGPESAVVDESAEHAAGDVLRRERGFSLQRVL